MRLRVAITESYMQSAGLTETRSHPPIKIWLNSKTQISRRIFAFCILRVGAVITHSHFVIQNQFKFIGISFLLAISLITFLIS